MPDQWLEVMVTGGFKVWHIIFIIIAFLVTMVVVYCCFHRCRIPRTKQEIEADLMRSTLTDRFRDYLQELPNEPTTFLEAIKKVQDLEEKMEKDDAQMSRDLGARKRMGWLKLKGKDGKEVKEVKEDNKDNKDNKDSEKPKLNGQISADLSALGEQISTKGITPVVEPVAQVAQAPDQSVEPEVVEPKVKDEMKDEAPDKRQDSTNKDQDPKGSLQKHPRRRKHKPNLARTKRAREKSHGELELERPGEPNSNNSAAVLMPPVPTQTTNHHRHHHRSRIESHNT